MDAELDALDAEPLEAPKSPPIRKPDTLLAQDDDDALLNDLMRLNVKTTDIEPQDAGRLRQHEQLLE